MNIALVLSGGTGTRLESSVPKQYVEVGEKPVIAYCLETLLKHENIDAVQIVADSMWHGLILSCMENMKIPAGPSVCMGSQETLQGTPAVAKNLQKAEAMEKFRGFSTPGKTRQLSIYNGLKDILEYASGTDCVLIHDAARPLLSARLISGCLSALDGHDGVLPVLPMKDTVYFSRDGQAITSLLDRRQIFAGQAPEAFCLGKYFEANRRLMPDRISAINGSTEPAVLAGMDIAMIPGEEENFKITTKADLERFWKSRKPGSHQ